MRFKPARGRRLYAYLVWQEAGRRTELYIGEATGKSRAANLDIAWAMITTHALLTPAGREQWKRRFAD